MIRIENHSISDLEELVKIISFRFARYKKEKAKARNFQIWYKASMNCSFDETLLSLYKRALRLKKQSSGTTNTRGIE